MPRDDRPASAPDKFYGADPQTVHDILTEEERILGKIQGFFGQGVKTKTAETALGSTYAIPRKVASYGDIALGRLGVPAHADSRVELRAAADELSHSPLTDMRGFPTAEEVQAAQPQTNILADLVARAVGPRAVPPVPVKPPARPPRGIPESVVLGAYVVGVRYALKAHESDGRALQLAAVARRVIGPANRSADLSKSPIGHAVVNRLGLLGRRALRPPGSVVLGTGVNATADAIDVSVLVNVEGVDP